MVMNMNAGGAGMGGPTGFGFRVRRRNLSQMLSVLMKINSVSVDDLTEIYNKLETQLDNKRKLIAAAVTEVEANPSAAGMASWPICSRCTYNNRTPDATSCEMCGAAGPKLKAPKAPKAPPFGGTKKKDGAEGDWTCLSCGSQNKGDSATCAYCFNLNLDHPSSTWIQGLDAPSLPNPGGAGVGGGGGFPGGGYSFGAPPPPFGGGGGSGGGGPSSHDAVVSKVKVQGPYVPAKILTSELSDELAGVLDKLRRGQSVAEDPTKKPPGAPHPGISASGMPGGGIFGGGGAEEEYDDEYDEGSDVGDY